MNKIERMDRVLNGQAVDYAPLSLWYHFGVQHGGGADFARITLGYFKAYDLDFLKVMSDYFYPMPEGMDAVKTKADLAKVARFDVRDCEWREQFKALEIINRELDGVAYTLDTVFDPWQVLKRSLCGEHLATLMETESDALLAALDVVTENIIDYCKTSLSLGTTGIFMSVPAGKEIMDRDKFLKFCKPFAFRIFDAVKDPGRLNTAHIHGDSLWFEDCLDFPVPVLNWWDRGPDGPSLAWVKKHFDGCVMGGIDQDRVTRVTREFLKAHVKEGRKLGGDRRFILANGCSIPTWTEPGAIHAIVSAAREPL